MASVWKLRACLVVGLLALQLVVGESALGAGWDRYAGGVLRVENRHNLAVYERRSDRFRLVRLPGEMEIINAGWDNVRLVINCLDPRGEGVRYVFLTPDRFHVERQ
ncbi:MAG: hypothetical protein N2315_07245 [Thermanaerothrix sp.]|nr:hypothetical protein [Thermanaerothrix sp.]